MQHAWLLVSLTLSICVAVSATNFGEIVAAKDAVPRTLSRVERESLPALSAGPLTAHWTADKVNEPNCTTCANNSTCCGGNKCCGGGAFCCAASDGCCGDTCCEGVSESCCPDPTHGGVCCTREDTFCCAPSPNKPSRCCPRWFVCCEGGKFGCCDPGTGLPMEIFEEMLRQNVSSGSTANDVSVQATSQAWALFVIPSLKEAQAPMYGVSVDLDKNAQERQPAVQGFNDWGEMTRKFAFDTKRSLFYLPQANFTGPGKDEDRPIHLYTTDPKTGLTTSMPVTGGPVGLVTGFAYNTTGVIYMATRMYDADKPIGYYFWSLDVATAAATLISSQNNSGSQMDNFSGYFKRAATVGGKLLLYRVGYSNAVAELGPGIGVTDVSTPNATTTWIDCPGPEGFGNFFSMDFASASGTEFVSMAESAKGLTAELSLFRWSIDLASGVASNATKVADLGNAHTTPYFGPLGNAVSPDFSVWAGLVVHASIDSHFDLWSLAHVNLQTGEAKTHILEPRMLAETDSVSGFGIPE